MKAVLLAAALILSVPLAMSSLAHAGTATARNYDCTKPGNANKKACKAEASATSTPPVPMASATSSKARNYDCTKAGNMNKAACKTATAATPALPANSNIPSSNQSMKPVSTASKKVGTVSAQGAPSGATALCRDGSYSFSQHHSGSCSHHGGVQGWL